VNSLLIQFVGFRYIVCTFNFCVTEFLICSTTTVRILQYNSLSDVRSQNRFTEQHTAVMLSETAETTSVSLTQHVISAFRNLCFSLCRFTVCALPVRMTQRSVRLYAGLQACKRTSDAHNFVSLSITHLHNPGVYYFGNPRTLRTGKPYAHIRNGAMYKLNFRFL